MGKDANRLITIIKYCDKIEARIEEFGNDIEDFLSNDTYHDVCSFYLSQIGENVGFISPKLTEKHPDISWVGLMELRNTVTHGYEGMDLEAVWTTITKKVPRIKKTCERILRELKP
ncbi:MAG: DUF86 domain-containing protein [Methanomassiliicoccaceae archaeon]|nr:DUF86 domain-containing protein [Methanomassiliicoccaceae archaeon]